VCFYLDFILTCIVQFLEIDLKTITYTDKTPAIHSINNTEGLLNVLF